MDALVEMVSGWLGQTSLPTLLADAGVKSLAVLAVAACLSLACRRAAAATRHWLWFLVLASLPCLALLAYVPHSWHRPLWSVSTGFNSGNQFSLTLDFAPAREAVTPAPLAAPTATAPANANHARATSRQSVAAHFSITSAVLGMTIWLLGTVASLSSLLIGHLQLRRLARSAAGAPASCRLTRSEQSKPATCRRSGTSSFPAGGAISGMEADWALLLREACDQLRLRRPVRLLQSAANPIPLTWGWWRPVILLPADAAHWPADRRQIVLLHELAHAKRWDCLTQTVARIVCAFYWINPLVWLASRRMCVERERACDDLVLNSGCRPSDYATHLVDIARTFRRTPRLAGIAMARSSQLHGRIAAIVDASRARQLRPLTALTLLILMGALALSVGGSSSDTSRKRAEDSRALREQQIAQEGPSALTDFELGSMLMRSSQSTAQARQQQFAQLQSFAQAKQKQSQELAAKAGEEISPEFQSFFDAAIKGDWRTVTNRYGYYKQHHPQYSKGTNDMEVQLRTAYWQPVLEICLAYDQVVNCDPKYTALLADGIINSIPAGSIYFGGTDPGRGVPTAFCKSSIDADPFFTLTQNALADGTYLEYLRAMYGGKIYTPTSEDSQRCFQEYLSGAMRRLQEHKLQPGEDVKVEEKRVQVSGRTAVMAINGLLAKVIFDENTNRQFYLEESFPLDWMYPYLEPQGLIMKLNRQPLPQVPEDVIARDDDYWRKLVAGMLGDWLDEETTVRQVTDFVDRVYVRHDLTGFKGDPRFIQNDYAQRTFSKLRSSIAGAYAWRFSTNAPPEYSRKTGGGRLFGETDLAFRQAFALCPSSPEALSRYVEWLLSIRGPNEAVLREVPKLRDHPILLRLAQQGSNRVDDARLLIETVLKLDPQNAEAQSLLQKLKSYRSQQDLFGGVTNRLASVIKPVPGTALTAAQAEALAEQLANEKAESLYNCQPFRKGTPAQSVQGRWVWHDLRAQGSLDVDATVQFAADGTDPDVKVVVLDGRPGLIR